MRDSFRNLFHPTRGHERLLTIWGAAHYGSALLAFCVFCSLLRCSVALTLHWKGGPDCDSAQMLILEFVCLALFGITFYRFTRGDLKYLNWIYLILQGADTEDLLSKQDEERLRRDLIALIGRAFAFTALAYNITEPTVFFIPFALLLLVDIPWLAVRHRQCRSSEASRELTTCAETLLRWMVNNTVTLLALVTFMVLRLLGHLTPQEFLWLSVLACFTNSVVDLSMTRWVYRSRRP